MQETIEEIQAVNHETKVDAPSEPLPKRPSHRAARIIIVLVLLLLSAAVVIAFWTQRKNQPEKTESKAEAKTEVAAPQAVPADVAVATNEQLRQITVEAVTERTFDLERETTGKVAFNEEHMTPVFTPYAGRVIEVNVIKGAVVGRGQPLLTVESPELVAAQNDLVTARSDENKARIALEAAQQAADRAHGLYEHEAVAAKDLQQAEADLARAKDELHRAAAAVAVVESRLALFGKDATQLAQAGGSASPDRQVVIRAPIGGTIVERKVGLGQYIKSDTPDPLFLIADLSTVWVLADVYESALSKIRAGQPVEITVPAYPERKFPARISFINPTVDAATRTIRVRCQVPNAGGLLKPDMFARINIGVAVPQPVVVIPTGALLTQGSEAMVFVEEAPGRFRRKQVKAGRDVQGFTVIEDGLKPGERVATHGVLLLNELIGASNK